MSIELDFLSVVTPSKEKPNCTKLLNVSAPIYDKLAWLGGSIAYLKGRVFKGNLVFTKGLSFIGAWVCIHNTSFSS